MALRIRTDGRILCAAIHKEEKGDLYINDGLHYHLSQVAKVIVTDGEPEHSKHGEWWWLQSKQSQPTERMREALILLGAAKCPNKCGGGAIQIDEDEWMQCEWCGRLEALTSETTKE